MYTTYHLASADEVDIHILDAIKSAYKSRPITITVEEVNDELDVSQEMKAVLDNRLQEQSAVYLTQEQSLNMLRKKYGV